MLDKVQTAVEDRHCRLAEEMMIKMWLCRSFIEIWQHGMYW